MGLPRCGFAPSCGLSLVLATWRSLPVSCLQGGSFVPSLWEWVYLGQVAGDMADASARQALEARKNLNQYEDHLVEMATLLTKRWATLEDTILLVQRTDFDEQELRELRQFARDSRIEALGESARHRVGDPVEQRYKPLWDIFKEMADTEIRLYDEVLKACDTHEESDLTVALATARYCVSLGEQAILTMPAITRARLRQEQQTHEANRERNNTIVYGCLIAAGVILLLFIACAISIA